MQTTYRAKYLILLRRILTNTVPRRQLSAQLARMVQASWRGRGNLEAVPGKGGKIAVAPAGKHAPGTSTAIQPASARKNPGGRPVGSTDAAMAAALVAAGQPMTVQGYRDARKLAKGLATEMPVAERVRRYVALARGQESAAETRAQLEALKRIDDLRGVVTTVERVRMLGKYVDATIPVPTPAFALPPGARLRIAAELTVPPAGDPAGEPESGIRPDVPREVRRS